MRAHSNSPRRDHPSRRVSHRGRSGFTIIELVVVLVLITIVSAVVGPALWRAATPDTASTLSAPVVSLLRFAQRTAAQQNQVVTVLIDPSTNSYQAQTRGDGQTRASGTLTFPTQTHFITDSARLRVTFNPAGAVTADSIIVSDAQNAAVIHIDPWTGSINVTRQ
jgi:prepilin-type N-terminal cleavage/methylation domain-containing protein